MIPLDFFTEISRICAQRPFALLSESEQTNYANKIKEVIGALKNRLEDRQLTKTHSYYIVSAMDQSLQSDPLDEVRFAQALSQLSAIYGPSTPSDLLNKVHVMHSFAQAFRRQTEEFYFSEEGVLKKVLELKTDDINTHDLKILQEIGSFYIWEYTLILEQEMHKADEKGKRRLLSSGLSVAAGNLPGLTPLVASFRHELAFHIYNKEHRWEILRIFYDFEDILRTDDLLNILKGLREFHIRLLTVALQMGLTEFTGFIYKPYPDHTPLQAILGDLQKSL